MEHEVKERLTVDSVMTADGEVLPLGSVDKEGRKVPLSTATLYADSGMECTVKGYVYLIGAGVWRADCDEGVVRVDDMHLTCPDTFGALMLDIKEAVNSFDEGPIRVYNVTSGVSDVCNGKCNSHLCQMRALNSICCRIRNLRGEGE